MQVLHAHWHFPSTPVEEGGMLFWVENSDLPAPCKLRGRRGKKARPHPFCAEPKIVDQVLAQFDSKTAWRQYQRFTLLLPTTRFGPTPSPQLVHNWDLDHGGEPALFPWIVRGVWVPPEEIFSWLGCLPRTESLPGHLALGADVRYWQTVTSLVLEILAQQKLLPVLAQADPNGIEYHARWLPVLDTPQDASRITRLQQAMPALCRAESDAPENAPAPRIVLETFVNVVTDALARRWGRSAQPRFPSATRDIAHEWLKALFADSPQVAGSAAQLRHLARSHKLWLRNLHVAGDKTFRVGFRLAAPSKAADPSNDTPSWQLHYLLQARDDPSLLVRPTRCGKPKAAC